ncbi:MAG: MBOAT family protein [Gemmatimonadota bacterium]|nr:MBOAT family protein [Gemmatimonadota bacterium]
MVFNSLLFLAFFAIVLGVHSLPIPWRARKFNLLVASYLFYAAWNPPFVLLIWLSTIVDWWAAKWIERSDDARRRRAFLILSLCTNLGLLAFFKYGGFLLDNFVVLLGSLGIEYRPASFNLVLPVGISFYTFQTLSYTIDVYRGKLRTSKSFLDYALYVTFFPQLVAGPIVRASTFLPQCIGEKRGTRSQIAWGFTLLTIGLFQKVVLADALLAPTADLIFANAYDTSFQDAWLGTLAFSAQIFYDFAGYSTCAIGAAMCLGFVLPDNFRFPYAAIGFSDFWRRWHISLSEWLRDYLYIPLGGNRTSAVRVHVNLLITMLLGGLWHGAAWRFVAWGGLHGIYLIVERILVARFSRFVSLESTAVRVCLALVTYGLVCLTWVFFRATDFASAWAMLRAMTIGSDANLIVGTSAVLSVGAVTLFLLATHWWLRDSSLEQKWGRLGLAGQVIVLLVMLVSLALVHGDQRAFIYFQF